MLIVFVNLALSISSQHLLHPTTCTTETVYDQFPIQQQLSMSSAVPIAPSPSPLRKPRRHIQTASSSTLRPQQQRRALPTPPPSLPAPPPTVPNNVSSISPDTAPPTPSNCANNDVSMTERTPAPTAPSPPAPAPAPTASADSAETGEENNDSSPDKLSPWSMEYEPIPMRAPARPTMRDLTFTYLWGQKVYRPASGPLAALPSLRWLAKNLSPSVLQEGPKCKLVCRLMLRMEHIVAAGHGSWESAFEPHRSNYYEILREKYIVRQVYVAPSHHALLDGMPHGRERIRHDRDGKRAVQLIALDAALPADESEETNVTREERSACAIQMAGDYPNNAEARSTSSAEPGLSSAPPLSAAGTPKTVSPAPVTRNEPPIPPTTPIFVEPAVNPPPSTSAVTATLPPPSPLPPSPILTVSEFVRLMAAVTRNEAARAAVRKRELWDREITPAFNDEAYRPHVVIPELHPIDSTSPPSTPWTGASLQREYDAVHGAFLQARAQWFAARTSRDQITPFVSFVNLVCGTTKMNRKGSLVFAMFTMLRCDRPDEFTELVRGRSSNGDMEPNGSLRKRGWKRRKFAVGTEAAKIVGPVSAAVKDSCEVNGSACCRVAVEKVVSVVAGSAVNAAVTSALSTKNPELDVVQTLETLRKLEAMRVSVAGDKALPEYMKAYVEKEIATLKRKIEAHQSGS